MRSFDDFSKDERRFKIEEDNSFTSHSEREDSEEQFQVEKGSFSPSFIKMSSLSRARYSDRSNRSKALELKLIELDLNDVLNPVERKSDLSRQKKERYTQTNEDSEQRANDELAVSESSTKPRTKLNGKERVMNGANEYPQSRDVSNAFCLNAPPDATTTIGGKSYLYFGGNGFLGLQADPEMISAACNAALTYGLGSATSRDSFTAAPVQEVERNAARFFSAAKAYYVLDESLLADLFLTALNNSFERAFVDEAREAFWRERLARLNEFGFVDKSRARVKELVVFKHCDSGDLSLKLENELLLDERPLVLTDGVFSNDGSIAPLRDYADILTKYGESALLIDDSYGVGSMGATGRGSLELFQFDLSQVNQTGAEVSFDPSGVDADLLQLDNLEVARDARAQDENVKRDCQTKLFMFASLANAMGGFGAVAAGSDLFVEKLKELNQANYSVPPNPIAAATARGFQIIDKEQFRLERLRFNSNYLRNGLRRLGFGVDDSDSPIVVVQTGSFQNMKRAQRELERDRILATFLPIKYRNARGLIRFAVFSTHTREMLDMLLDSLQRIFSR